jgi:hypothetical protein
MKYLENKPFSTPANSNAFRDNWDSVFGTPCTRCGDTDLKHQDDHPDCCCDCFDLSMLEQLNAERAEKGKPPLELWPK